MKFIASLALLASLSAVAADHGIVCSNGGTGRNYAGFRVFQGEAVEKIALSSRATSLVMYEGCDKTETETSLTYNCIANQGRNGAPDSLIEIDKSTMTGSMAVEGFFRTNVFSNLACKNYSIE